MHEETFIGPSHGKGNDTLQSDSAASKWRPETFDPRTPAFFQNRYSFYERLRVEDPVHNFPHLRLWWLTRYADVLPALTDKRLGKKDLPVDPDVGAPMPKALGGLPLPKSMLTQDPPDHTRLRSLVNKAFTPRMVEGLGPRIELIANQLLDRCMSEGQMDLAADFAFPLPAIVIAELLGVPPADRDLFRAWSADAALAVDPTQPTAVRRAGSAAVAALADYFAQLVQKRRDAPASDLISQMIAIEDDGDRLSYGEMLSMCVTLLAAGHETTANLFANGALSLLRHPDQLELLRAHPELLPTAVEELLRYDSPVQGVRRAAAEDFELGGKLIRKGDWVTPMIGAANRDPAVFADPERLDITRKENPHLAFGRGIHFCLGAPLARLEGEIGFRVLLERLPQLSLAEGDPAWTNNSALRTLKSLHVRF
jgi:pimeloyl-[acyl-carrier protein] synthase